jgi:hypothetical protein
LCFTFGKPFGAPLLSGLVKAESTIKPKLRDHLKEELRTGRKKPPLDDSGGG